jgi:hypothetical protein
VGGSANDDAWNGKWPPARAISTALIVSQPSNANCTLRVRSNRHGAWRGAGERTSPRICSKMGRAVLGDTLATVASILSGTRASVHCHGWMAAADNTGVSLFNSVISLSNMLDMSVS